MPTTRHIDTLTDAGKSGSGLLSVKQAASYLNMSEGWLYQSHIPFVRLGSRRLYRRSDLDVFIEQNLSHGQRR